MKTKHTPTPWEIWPNSQSGQLCISHFENHSNLQSAICEVDNADEENAAFIVRACNAHDDLVAALTRWQQFAANNGWTDSDHHDSDGTGWISATNAALAKAKGEA